MSDGGLLEARGLGRRVPGGEWLLHDVSLAVRPGDRVALVGPSGGGKTLLLRALAFLDPLDAGAVYWRGGPVGGGAVPAFRREVIYLHQRPSLFEGTVEDNLRLPFALKVHTGRHFDKARATGLLAALGREPSFLDKQQADLSGGEMQVTALVRALQLDPTVLLLDEPTAALDPDTARAAEALVRRWREEEAGRAYVWVSHDPGQALRVAGRRVRMRAGRLEGEG
jgi:putative ABC transport system ATP-binding protein